MRIRGHTISLEDMEKSPRQYTKHATEILHRDILNQYLFHTILSSGRLIPDKLEQAIRDNKPKGKDGYSVILTNEIDKFLTQDNLRQLINTAKEQVRRTKKKIEPLVKTSSKAEPKPINLRMHENKIKQFYTQKLAQLHCETVIHNRILHDTLDQLSPESQRAAREYLKTRNAKEEAKASLQEDK